MKVKLILPALTASQRHSCRRIRYSLWPPIGLATLAGYLRDNDEVALQDENVEALALDDEPDLVGIQVSVSSARRAYEIADHYRRKGAHVALGGLHVTSLPAEAIRHAHTIFLGPGEHTWPQFLQDFREGRPGRVYRSAVRTLAGQPPLRRDLIKRHLYLAPNSLVVSRGCPHRCDFCSNTQFFRGGKSFYTQTVDQALAEIDRLPGRHLYFLDDHIFGNRGFARALFDGLRGMNRIWQSAGTVDSALDRELVMKAADSGLRTLLVGFETLSADNLREQHKLQNLRGRYETAVRVLHDAGVMVNASFVLGLDNDDVTVFDRTVEWAIERGIETVTFHILTPYPGTELHRRMATAGRIATDNWDLYDTCHVVFRPAKMSAEQLQDGYLRAYRDFYRWGSILRSAWARQGWRERLRHATYAGGWGRCELLWHLALSADRVGHFTPLLEAVLASPRAPSLEPVGKPAPAAPAVGLPWQRRLRAAGRHAAVVARPDARPSRAAPGATRPMIARAAGTSRSSPRG